jgi:hypothetical protein
MIQRANVFAEDKVINASMGIEALGGVLGATVGERGTLGRRGAPTTATYFYRALDAVGIDGAPIASNVVELARALANIYNDIKHADRGDFPHGLVMIYAAQLSLMLARLAILIRVPGARRSVVEFAQSWPVRRIFEGMKTDGIEVRNGRFNIVP